MKLLTRLVVAFTLLALVTGLFSPAVLAAGGEDATETDRFIVRYRPGVVAPVAKDRKGKTGKMLGRIDAISAEVVSVSRAEAADVVASYRGRADVESIEPDYIASVVDVPNDPNFSRQWGMTRIKAPEAWDITRGNLSIKIAILDTGIDLTHPDLAGKIVASQNFSDSVTADDLYGHGSHCAGIAAAATSNGVGVAGVGYNTSLMNVKVMGDSGSGYYSSIINGIIWAADNGAGVVSMSLGGASGSTAMQQAIDYAWNKGVVVVAAAGNNGSSTPSYPAYYANCIAVAATDPNDARYSFSNYGTWVDVAAPGSAYSTYRDGGYATMSGTSMATPHVAGLAGLVMSVAKDTNGNGRFNDEVRSLIETTCDSTGVSGIGSGRINAYKAVSSVTPPAVPGNIGGVVTDTVTAGPIAGAKVSDGTRTATTDAAGLYTLSNVPAGSYTVTATMSGYNGISKTATVTAGATSTANFALAKTPVTPTMWVDSITFSSSGSYLTARVKVVNPQPVSGARVTINISGRSYSSYSAYTGTSGEAVFRIYAPGHGTYTVNVTRLSYSNYAWDTSKGMRAASYTK